MNVSTRCLIEPIPTETAQSIRPNCSRSSQRKPQPVAVVPVEGRAAARADPAVVVDRVAKVVDPVATLREAPVVPEEVGRVVVPAEQVAADPVGLLNQDRSCRPSCKTNCD